jgi:hypothetical protein
MNQQMSKYLQVIASLEQQVRVLEEKLHEFGYTHETVALGHSNSPSNTIPPLEDLGLDNSGVRLGQSPSSSSKTTPVSECTENTTSDPVIASFTSFWFTWPRKHRVGKQRALAAFILAAEHRDANQIVETARAFVKIAEPTGDSYPTPTIWLNGFNKTNVQHPTTPPLKRQSKTVTDDDHLRTTGELTARPKSQQSMDFPATNPPSSHNEIEILVECYTKLAARQDAIVPADERILYNQICQQLQQPRTFKQFQLLMRNISTALASIGEPFLSYYPPRENVAHQFTSAIIDALPLGVGVLTIAECSPIDSDEPPEGYQELKEKDTHLILRSTNNTIEKSLAGEEFELEIEPRPTTVLEEKMLTKEIVEQFLADEDSVDLGEFTAIQPEAAERLSKREYLDLRGLTSLSDATAEILSKHKGEIYLSGLTSLSDDAAESLSKHKGEIDLSGLTALSDAAAKRLCKHEAGLHLRGLTSLSDGPGHIALAESLSKHEGYLVLNGLTDLSDATAEILSKHKGEIDLSGLTSLSDAAAEILSKHKGEIDLSGLTALSDATAESLSKHDGKLRFSGITNLSDASAKRLCKHEGDIHLRGLTSLSDAAAESLSKHKGEIYLSGLTSLSDGPGHIALAESLSKHEGYLVLNDLTDLSDAAARSLANKEPKFDSWQIELENLPASAAQILRDAGHG